MVPYINHPIQVALLLAEVGGVEDRDILSAAVLHDILEDTETTADEIEAAFGLRVRALVEELTDDQTLPKETRKRHQVEHAASLTNDAKQLKLADKISNVSDIATAPPAGWSEERRDEYLNWAEAVVRGCRGVNAALDAAFDDRLERARVAIAARG